MIFIVKLHVLPVCLKISEQLLHAHLLARLVHDPVHLVLKVVEVEAQQIRQGCVVAHCELHPRCLHQLHGGELARRESENLPNLVPVTIPDRGVLKLSNGSQTRDHVLHRCVQTLISVPGTHRLVKAANVLTGKWI